MKLPNIFQEFCKISHSEVLFFFVKYRISTFLMCTFAMKLLRYYHYRWHGLMRKRFMTKRERN